MSSAYRRFSTWMTKLAGEPAMAIILLIVTSIIIVIATGLFLLTGNLAIVGLIGVIIGAVFGILQTIIGATWLEPLKRKQERTERKRERREEREEREQEQNRQREDENNKLRRAVYGEILNAAMMIGSTLAAHNDFCDAGAIGFAQSTEKSWGSIPISFRVYESLKTAPVSFYQLADSSEIDFAYNGLITTYVRLQSFESTAFDSADAARVQCKHLITSYKVSLATIDKALFEDHKIILENLDSGNFLKRWSAIKTQTEKSLGDIYQPFIDFEHKK